MRAYFTDRAAAERFLDKMPTTACYDIYLGTCRWAKGWVVWWSTV